VYRGGFEEGMRAAAAALDPDARHKLTVTLGGEVFIVE
jgi:hypothetical protein